jgi:NTP pyrophosphatase (non-canonical NTP hydrolase)
MSYAEYEMKIIQWSEARKIIPNSTPMAQLCKLEEEVNELRDALFESNREESIDAIGDCTVVLINICALLDVNLTDCLAHAFEQIKNRKGYMNEQGLFIKETA